jgi:pilus assembly protein TadC
MCLMTSILKLYTDHALLDTNAISRLSCPIGSILRLKIQSREKESRDKVQGTSQGSRHKVQEEPRKTKNLMQYGLPLVFFYLRSSIFYLFSFFFYLVSCILFLVSSFLHLVPSLRLEPCTLACTLYLVPCILYLISSAFTVWLYYWSSCTLFALLSYSTG